MSDGRRSIVLVLATLALVAAACSSNGSDEEDARDEDALPDDEGTISLTSSAFEDGEEIPTRFTCDGDDNSPPLAWSDIPDEAVEVVLIVDDPDAPSGTFTHWVAYRISAETTDVGEGGDENLINGINDFGDAAWGGPCPPEGDGPHTYVFELSALSETSGLDPGASREDLEAAIDDSVLGTGRLTGTYER